MSDTENGLASIFYNVCGKTFTETERGINVFETPNSLNPRDIAEVFLVIEQNFNVQLNLLVPMIDTFTFKGIAKKLDEIIHKKEIEI